ncbi:peroxidase family protein [Sphingopyxis sp. R3-92]|uniref:peroxidase family protein n=1 Tax=Sphingopyxis sp. R3-92 TaxID=3158553 RepID=UPI003EE44DA4
MVQLTKHDLNFILAQIKIAEAHAAGGDLAALVAGYNGNDGFAQAHLLPYGLRTVDGSYNNLLPGRENWGAADQSFPGIFTPEYMNDADGDRYDFNPAPNGPGADGIMGTADDTGVSWYTNNNYANAGTRTGSQPGPGSGTVIDADPRIISNLIVDQTLKNPAAIAAALTHAGLSGQPLMTALTQIVAARDALEAAVVTAAAANGTIGGLTAAVAAAQLALTDAQAADAAAVAQAATDLAASEAADAEVAPAMVVRDVSLAAFVALLADAIPNNQQTAEITAAEDAYDAAEAAYQLAQDNAGAAEAASTASAAAAADAAAALLAAQAALTGAETALADAQAAAGADEAASAALDAALAEHGVEMDGNTVYLPNVSPDEGLSSPFNGWMTIFGQFFDHGLDLVAKGGNGTVYVPLSPDDPLYVPGGQNYIPLTRVSVNPGADGILGTADDGPGPKNLTTPWVDQNQTYASSASKQVFMREYVAGPDGKPIATGLLLEGSNGGLATWADIKAQARTMLGIELTDLNVGNIPLIATDPYGNFIPGANGYPQMVAGLGPDGQLGTADDVMREGNPTSPVSAQGVALTGHAFLDDIAHAAAPIVNGSGVLQQDSDSALGYANADGSPGPQGQRGPTAYDNELLDRHFIAGDGRANENIALTAVHQVFHAEHNRIVEHTKDVTLASMDRAFINEWLLTDLTDAQFATLTSGNPAAIATLSESLAWDGERLFQVGRFTNEMEYQHLVFEEFGRMMQPDIDAFVFEPSADINPSIAAEFAHVVYRFGHSMLRQDIAVIEMDANGNPVQNDISLFDGFLNPVMYDSLGTAEEASGAIIRGMSRQTGSEIDEFVTDVLRNQLLGIPLDLATINLARGRDVGMPSLQTARERFFEATGDTLLKPYESWADFALNLKNPASIINFIAAYGTHESVLNTAANPKTVEELREAATLLVLGGAGAPADRLDFLNAEGAYANDAKLGGLNDIDFWIGGLAEKKMAFGGMLGSTFSFVFQMTMENLQDADRFYYLSRTQGLNLLNELENNTFAELVMRNTDLGDDHSTALPGNLFSGFEMPQLEMDISKQLGADPVSDDPFLGGFSSLVERIDANNDGVAEYIRINSNEHFVVGGTENDDVIVSGGGDDAIWGKGGNDRIEAGYGVDKVFGGEGDDIITNAGTDIGEADFLHGNEGNDVIHGGSGLSLLFGNQGNDFIITGPDGKEAFGGTGNDFILGGSGGDFLLGNEGDDWLEGGQRFDTLAGENSELFFNSSIIGHDVMNGGSGDTDYDAESGDDIMFQNNEGIQRSNGQAGFDWGIHKGDVTAANSDLGIPIFETQEAFILRDRFDLVEGLSGWIHDDTLTGRSRSTNARGELQNTAAIPGPDSPLDSYSNDLLAKNVDLIDGLDVLVAHLGAGIPVTKVVNGQTIPVLDENGVQERIIFSTSEAGDILLGGGGSDTMKGLAGNDIIDGDRWLNVRILVTPKEGDTWQAFSVDSMTEIAARMVAGEINPGQLSIVRELLDGDADNSDVDTAVYTDVFANYTITRNADGSVTVDHTGFDDDGGDDDLPEEVLNRPLSDGTDRLFNIEKLQFSDRVVDLRGPTLALQTTPGEYQDEFTQATLGNSHGATNWVPDWVESNDSGGITAGQIRIDEGNSNVLRFHNGDGAQIQRTVDLAGAVTATLSFSANPDNLDAGENVEVWFAADGANFTLLRTITGNGGNQDYEHQLTGPFTANAAIRFVASAINATNEQVSIDNVTIDFATSPVQDYETTFTEDSNEVAIARGPFIVENDGQLVSARIILTNAQAGDQFVIPNNLPGNINSQVDTSVAGRITVTLTGAETIANYQAAIQAIEFENTSDNPAVVDRVVEVTVNGGFSDSNVATTTINVVAVDDDVNANNDTIITNVSGATIVVPKWALLLNDVDPDSPISITAVSNANSLNGLAHNATSVSFTDPATGTAGGSFTYTATGAPGDNDNATVTVTRDTAGNIDGTTGANILIGSDAANTFDAGTGDDIVFAGGGNDTIVWNANGASATSNNNSDGRDIVDGGAGTDDTFTVNGNNTTEAYRIYSRAEANAAGLTVRNPDTEIVITRGGTTNAFIIAELDNIEEIVVNTGNGNDTVQVIGNFAPTSLDVNTITINGGAGDDTVDIGALQSAHRVVFRSNGGNDVIIGEMRAQDRFELADGKTIADYTATDNDDGSTTLASEGHSVTFFGTTANAQNAGPSHDDDDHDDDDVPVSPPSGTDTLTGTAGKDKLNGGSADDVIHGRGGDDVIGGGSGDDRLEGEAGDDSLSGGSGDDVLLGGGGDDMLAGGSGDDRLDGGSGDDVMTGGSGDDIFVFGEGDDRVTDFRMGEDSIDLSGLGITAQSFASRVVISQSGADTIVRIDGNELRLDGVAAANMQTASFAFASTGPNAASPGESEPATTGLPTQPVNPGLASRPPELIHDRWGGDFDMDLGWRSRSRFENEGRDELGYEWSFF